MLSNAAHWTCEDAVTKTRRNLSLPKFGRPRPTSELVSTVAPRGAHGCSDQLCRRQLRSRYVCKYVFSYVHMRRYGHPLLYMSYIYEYIRIPHRIFYRSHQCLFSYILHTFPYIEVWVHVPAQRRSMGLMQCSRNSHQHLSQYKHDMSAVYTACIALEQYDLDRSIICQGDAPPMWPHLGARSLQVGCTP